MSKPSSLSRAAWLAVLGLPGVLGAACYPRLEITVPSGDLGTDDSGQDGGTDGGTPGELTVDGLLPTDGPTSGDTVVEIVGGPFDSTARVRFGDREGVVENVETDRIQARSPSATAAGLVDLTVELDSAQGSLPDAWYYWEDADGQAVLLGTWLQFTVANDDTWSGGTATFDAWVRYTQATDSQAWQRYGVSMDACGDGADTLSSLQGPKEVLLGYESVLLSLTWAKSRQEYAYQAISAPDPTPDAAIVLQATRSDLSPPLALPEVVRTPPQTTVIAPDLAASDIPELKLDEATITWDPKGYHHVMIQAGTSTEASFLCFASDDGEWTIPSTFFEDLSWTTTGLERHADIWLSVTGVASGETSLAWTDGVARFDAGLGLIGRVRVVDALLGVAP